MSPPEAAPSSWAQVTSPFPPLLVGLCSRLGSDHFPGVVACESDLWPLLLPRLVPDSGLGTPWSFLRSFLSICGRVCICGCVWGCVTFQATGLLPVPCVPVLPAWAPQLLLWLQPAAVPASLGFCPLRGLNVLGFCLSQVVEPQLDACLTSLVELVFQARGRVGLAPYLPCSLLGKWIFMSKCLLECFWLVCNNPDGLSLLYYLCILGPSGSHHP